MRKLHKTIPTVLLLTLSLSAITFVYVRQATTANVPDKIRLFDKQTLYVHGYMVFKYNSNTSSPGVSFSMPLWASNPWSDISVMQTAPRASGMAYTVFDIDTKEYVPASKDDHNSIYAVGYDFIDVQPYQEIKTEVWFKLSASKVDMSGVLNEHVRNVSDASDELGTEYAKYVGESYYWDYSNSSVQKVVDEINSTLGGSQNVYDIAYAAVDWFSTNMVYTDHEDYPNQRVKASQILNETIDIRGVEKYYGVCRHFVDAFVAIMRSFGVPTNRFEGLVFYDMGGNVGVLFAGGHAWCEIYMPSIGWVPIDVTISDKYLRDIIRVGLISEYYYLPTYKEFTNLGPEEKPPGQPKPAENLIGAYWGWEVGGVPVGTFEGIIHAITSIPIINWILLVIILVLIIDSLLIRRKLKMLTESVI